MKKILTTIVLAMMIISMLGCTSKTSTDTKKAADTAKTASSSEVKKFDYDTFVNALKKEGFKVEKGNAVAGCIGEIDGYQYKINGTAIGVYTIDINSKNPVTVNNIKMAKKSEKMNLDLQSGPMAVSAMINNNLVIMDYDKHPNKDKIIKIFKDLK